MCHIGNECFLSGRGIQLSGVESMATGKKKPIEQYEHLDKTRRNNPPADLVTPETDRDGEKKVYAYDPHLDPQLVWAGKAEHTSFGVLPHRRGLLPCVQLLLSRCRLDKSRQLDLSQGEWTIISFMVDPQKVKQLRESKGMSTRQLAREAGISTETIYSIEHGKRQPSVTTLTKIARALGVEVKDFFS
jgi:DNA-binding XRE family transcriptional regulator